jgi:hypothetical protein
MVNCLYPQPFLRQDKFQPYSLLAFRLLTTLPLLESMTSTAILTQANFVS